MPTIFDENRFRSLTGLELGEYVDQVNADGRQGVSVPVIQSLMTQIDQLDMFQGYLVFWWTLEW
jgi:hypothetical protein